MRILNDLVRDKIRFPHRWPQAILSWPGTGDLGQILVKCILVIPPPYCMGREDIKGAPLCPAFYMVTYLRQEKNF
jgi:hypothetical protein